MVEFKSDMARRHAFKHEKDCYLGDDYVPIQDRLNAMNAKKGKKKRKIPWLTIILTVGCLPMFFGGGSSGGGDMIAQMTRTANAEKTITSRHVNMKAIHDDMAENGNAKVTISYNGKSYEKEITPADLGKYIRN